MFSIFKSQKKFNLIILGAQKAGTTSLHNVLSKHPEIFMTNPIKEPGYFLPLEVMQEYYLSRGIKIKSEKHFKKILSKGSGNEKYFGESSTFYTTVEWSNQTTAQKMYSYNPNLKFIYITRDRSERIISHYKHENKKNTNLRFEDFLQNEESFGISMYLQRLKPYLDTFPKENFCFVKFETLISDSEQVLNKVFNFLNISTKENFQLAHLNQSFSISKEEKVKLLKIIKTQNRFQELKLDCKQFEEFLSTI